VLVKTPMYYMLYEAVYKPVDSKPSIAKAMWRLFTALKEKQEAGWGQNPDMLKTFFWADVERETSWLEDEPAEFCREFLLIFEREKHEPDSNDLHAHAERVRLKDTEEAIIVSDRIGPGERLNHLLAFSSQQVTD
jgi:hypothetical protein